MRHHSCLIVQTGASRWRTLQAHARAIQGTLQLLAMETLAPGMGSGLVVGRLADVLLVQAVRAHLAQLPEGSSGWIAALADARLVKREMGTAPGAWRAAPEP